MLVSILMTARSVALSTADHARRPAQILRVRIGGELDVDLVGLLDDVIVGDDVALGIDDEARAERFLHAAALVAAIRRGNLAAEEAVEEVLEVVGTLALLRLIVVAVIAVIARILLIGLSLEVEVARPLVGRLLGQRLRVDVHHRRSDLPGNLHKIIGRDGGVDHLERSGIRAVVLLFLSAHSVGRKGTGHNGG